MRTAVALLLLGLGLTSAIQFTYIEEEYPGDPKLVEKHLVSNRTLGFKMRQPNASSDELPDRMHVWAVYDGTGAQHKCDFDFAPEPGYTVLPAYNQIFAFARDKAVVVWIERKQQKMSLRLRSIDFPGCKMADHDLSINSVSRAEGWQNIVTWSRTKIFAYADTLDVFYFNKNQREPSFCKQSFHLYSDQAIGADTCVSCDIYELDSMKLFPVEDSSAPNKAYIVVMWKDGNPNSEVYYLSSNGTWKETPEYSSTSREVFVSSAHGTVRICSATERELHCQRVGGNDTRVQLDKDARLETIHNLPAGGFLTLTTRCTSGGRVCEDEHRIYAIGRVDDDGRKWKSLDIEKFVCRPFARFNEPVTRFYETESGEHCVSMLCNELFRYNVTSKCWRERDTSDEML